jgi:hypothetical protein
LDDEATYENQPRSAERVIEGEHHQLEEEASHLGTKPEITSRHETIDSKIDNVPSKMSTQPYLKPAVNFAWNAWEKVQGLDPKVLTSRLPSFPRQVFSEKVLPYLPSFPLGKSLSNFVKKPKSKVADTFEKTIEHNELPVPLEPKEELAQRIEKKKPIKPQKGKDLSKTSRANPVSSPKTLNLDSPTQTLQAVDSPHSPEVLNEGQKLKSGVSTENIAVSEDRGSRKGQTSLLSEPTKEMYESQYYQDYIKKNPRAKKKDTDLLAIIGHFMEADTVGSYTPILLKQENPYYKTLGEYITQISKGNDTGKKHRWLIDRIGDIEGRRRWAALTRQYNRPIILFGLQRYKSLPGYPALPRLEKILKLGESWPTFYDAEPEDYEWLKKVQEIEGYSKFLISILGEPELEYRKESIRIMSGRKYPIDWLSKEDAITLYQQGLFPYRLILVGDCFQFGKDRLSLSETRILPSYQTTYYYLEILWKDSWKDSWGFSVEKTWLMSDKKRAEEYTKRYELLKYHWKHATVSNEALSEIIPGMEEKLRKNPELIWWNLSDLIEWREYKMKLDTMAQIGIELKIPKARNKELDLKRLQEVWIKRKVSKQMKEVMDSWFRNCAISPYDKSPRPFELEPQDNLLSYARIYLAASWKQKDLFPIHQPDFLEAKQHYK